MSILKKLASQTAVYGLSSILGRFLNYLLVPLYTYYFSATEYGVVSEFYAYAGFFAVLLLFGLETGYFRFWQKAEKNLSAKRDVTYSTALNLVLMINVSFLCAILINQQALASVLNYAHHPEYIQWFAIILALDALAALPFARLRAENKAFRFAAIKLFEMLITVLLSLFFIVYCPQFYEHNPNSWIADIYQPTIGVGYIFIANLIASVIKLLLLSPQLAGFRWGIDGKLLLKMLAYSSPMVIIGFAGAINEMLDRALLKYWLPYDLQTNLKMLGIYGACYKLSVLMSLFIQAFRYAAEPFFFAYADKNDARAVYAKVLNYFVIFCVFIFLLVTLYLDIFQYFLGSEFREGLSVVPILLMANLCLGMYVNLSIWYKLTDRTLMGAAVSLLGAILTIVLNIWWIPLYGYIGSAWATLICYASMVIISYGLGQKYYPVVYDIKRVVGYICLGISLYLLKQYQPMPDWQPWLYSSALMLAYGLIVLLFEVRRPNER